MKHIIATLIALTLVVAGVNGAEFKAQNLVKASVATVSVADNITTNLPSTVYNDAVLWVNSDGSTAAPRLLVSLVGTNANATNTFTLTLQAVPDGSLVSTVSSTTNTYTAALKATGTTRVTDSFLLPAAFTTGAKSIRLVTVATDNKSTSGVTTLTAKACGYAP
jgi:hypothetical protein